ncbi:Serine/threonine-protein kinase 8 [Chlorella vulgaris]
MDRHNQSGAAHPEIADLGRYAQVGVLGSGAYGFVIRAKDTRDPEAPHVAIKLLPRGGFVSLRRVREYRRYVMREIMHHGGLKHPNIIDLREVFLTPQYLAIVMEYAQGGNLHRFLRERCPHNRLTEDQARWLFQQLIVGLDHCHRMGVANRDLKLENLLLDQDRCSGNPLLKVCDFGYSKHDLSSTANTRLGTPMYMAPEVIFVDSKYDAKKADVWSCGVILYALVVGYYPFNPADTKLPTKMMEGQVQYPEGVTVSPECRELIRGMLNPNPSRRARLSDIFSHSWFQKDLPAKALSMNDWYLDSADSLQERLELVQMIVETASAPGHVGEPLLQCFF